MSDVGADLLLRAARHRAAVPKLRKLNLQQQRGEESWYEESGGLIGRTIELFNRERRPDPARWAEVLRRWDEVASLLDAALETEVTPASINAVGESVMKALTAFQASLELSARSSSEFDTYLRGYSHSAEGFVKVTTVARDISFAAAVSVAVVVAAPVIFASGSTAAATIGLTGKAATLFAGGATVLGSGALGAAIEGGGQATSALLVESTELLAALTDKNTTWQQAIDRFSWREIGGQGWEGMKRGFVDGVLAYAALGFDKVLQAGVKVGLDRVLGNAGSTLIAQICRRALTRAISGGATGAVIGALDAGVKAALAKRSLGEIVGAMKLGFFLGAAIGIVLGGAGGGLEARAIQRRSAEILERLELLASEPDKFRSQYEQLLATMTQEQRVAFEREIAGRRFVDAEHYQPARREYEAGRSQTPPEHAYGEREFKDWSEAARELDAKAARGEPLTQSDVEAAHGTAARTLTEQPGVVRTSPGPLYASGGVGAHGLWTKLTPAEIAVLKSNPHILLDARGTLALKPKEVAAGLQTAVITYPEGGTVLARLQTFFAWFRQNQHAGDAIAFAARAQREFISIHPFIDGNGRVSRLVMDYALRSRGLPPSLLSNPNVDYLVSEVAWAAEIRKGVITTFETAQRHVGAFNSALRSGDLRLVALRWSAVLGLTSDPRSLIAWLYGGTSSSS